MKEDENKKKKFNCKECDCRDCYNIICNVVTCMGLRKCIEHGDIFRNCPNKLTAEEMAV